MTSVSVVIPCYNYGHFLADAVASVLDDQGGVDVGVLIIDDASTDDSAEVAAMIAARDRRVRAVIHPANIGHVATFNEGLLEWADADYCVLMSADDRLTPGALRRARDLLDAYPGVGFVYGHPLYFRDGAALPRPRTSGRGWSVWPGHWWLERRFREAQNCITAPEVVMRTSLLKRVGGFDPRLPHAGDMEMWMRLAAHSDVGYLRGVDQAYYRIHSQNMRKSYTPLMEMRQRRLACETLLERCGEQLPDPGRLADLVHRKLAREALWSAARAHARAHARGDAGQSAAAEYVAFAFDCWPEAGSLPEYQALRWCRDISPRIIPYVQPFVLSAAARKAKWWARRSWRLAWY